MSQSVFKYPGGKTQLFSWIEPKLCQHHTWVDVFGGSGVVTANKAESSVEVYNDADGDLVHFFETLRDNGDELREWLEATPHSRELHYKYSKGFYAGYRPEDDIERAGRFFYLRYTQWGTKYDSFSGYNGGKKRSAADSYNQGVDRLEGWRERFNGVQIERMDFADLIEKYDGKNTLFYCDPPYMDEGDDLYSHDTFDHKRFVGSLNAAKGDWIVSYTRVPEELEQNAERMYEQDRHVRMRQGQDDWEKTNTERLVLSYDPDTRQLFNGNNETLGVYQ